MVQRGVGLFEGIPRVPVTESEAKRPEEKQDTFRSAGKSVHLKCAHKDNFDALFGEIERRERVATVVAPVLRVVTSRIAGYAQKREVKCFAKKHPKGCVIFSLSRLSDRQAVLRPTFVTMMESKSGEILRLARGKEIPSSSSIHINFGTYDVQKAIRSNLDGIFSGGCVKSDFTFCTADSNDGSEGEKYLPKFSFTESQKCSRIFVLNLKYRSVTHGIISKNDVQRLVERSEEPYAKIESSNGRVCLERCEKKHRCT